MNEGPENFDSCTHICIKDGDLHKDQTSFDTEIYRWKHLELKGR